MFKEENSINSENIHKNDKNDKVPLPKQLHFFHKTELSQYNNFSGLAKVVIPQVHTNSMYSSILTIRTVEGDDKQI